MFAGVQIRRALQLFYHPTKPYDVGTQKNRLSATIILSTHNIGYEGQIRILAHANRPLSRALELVIMIIIMLRL